jgi:hypothetical protein
MYQSKEKAKITELRIIDVLKKDPNITNQQLCDRFGCLSSFVSKVRKLANVTCPYSGMVTKKDFK